MMASKSSKWRQKLKEENPEKYAKELRSQRDKYHASKKARDEYWSSGTRTALKDKEAYYAKRRMIGLKSKQKKEKAARENEGRITRKSSQIASLSPSRRVNRKAMTKEERREHDNKIRRERRGKKSREKRTAEKAAAAHYMRGYRLQAKLAKRLAQSKLLSQTSSSADLQASTQATVRPNTNLPCQSTTKQPGIDREGCVSPPSLKQNSGAAKLRQHCYNTALKVEFAVEMKKNAASAEKVEQVLRNIPGVKLVRMKLSNETVLVQGDFMAESAKKIIEKETGLPTAIVGQGTAESENLGSAVAAIAIGPSPVRGVIRMIQVSKESSVIEGTMDGFSGSKNVCISLHETGDLSQGCESCGPVYNLDAAGNNCDGILSSQTPSNDGSLEFRTASKLTVNEMLGRCIVVHEGEESDVKEVKSKRLACGIIARSSGLFQNTKRFCACDGVTIWEEKKKLDELDKTKQ